ncbi:MAG: TrmB family transcriptional regulator sugar-binding domain-containing protein [Halococcoides sp.]
MSSVRSIDAADGAAAVRDLIDRADRRVCVSVPAGTVDTFRDSLAAAVDRGVFTLLLVHDQPEPTEWSEIATIVRHSRGVEPAICTADEHVGVIGPPGAIATPGRGSLTLVEDLRLARLMFGSLLGNYWVRAAEVFVTDPDPLPARYDSFFAAVVRATQALQRRRPLRVIADTYPPQTIPAVTDREPTLRTGRLINARQGLLVPATNTFPVETSLALAANDRRFSLGGSGAIVEDYVADRIRLEPVEA